MKTVQIIADGFEGLFNFNSKTTDKEIKSFYKEFEKSEYDDFEDYMNEAHPDIVCERIFVDEIYI